MAGKLWVWVLQKRGKGERGLVALRGLLALYSLKKKGNEKKNMVEMREYKKNDHMRKTLCGCQRKED